jgi:RHS repeat-associated protein
MVNRRAGGPSHDSAREQIHDDGQISTSRFLTTDHVGSAGVFTDSSATIVGRYEFGPWGERTLTAGNDVSQIGFTGHRWQSSTALWLTQYRGYDAALGRWISQDPIGELGGLNLYAYSLNQPLTFIDPDGRNPGAAVITGARAGASAGAAAGGAMGGPVGAAVGGAIGGVIVGGILTVITWPPKPPKTTESTEVPKGPPVNCPPPPDNPCVLAALCLKAAKGVMAKARCMPLIIACIGSGLPQ